MVPSPLEAALTLIEGLIGQRDAIYSQTVNPRRNTTRALKAMEEEDWECAALWMDDVQRDLESVAALYRSYTQVVGDARKDGSSHDLHTKGPNVAE